MTKTNTGRRTFLITSLRGLCLSVLLMLKSEFAKAAGFYNLGAFWKKPGGTLWAFGANTSGQLGTGNVTARSSPVQIGSLNTWIRIACGGDYVSGDYSTSLAIRNDRTLWTWGSNDVGQLGTNNTTNRSSPVQVGTLTDWNQISAGWRHCVAIKTNGTLWTWGENNFGQLGDGTIINRSSPIQVGTLTTWAKISAVYDSIVALKTDGSLWSWGNNAMGRLGLGDTVARSSPVQVGALTTWAKVAAGDRHVVALQTDGTLWGWGINSTGNLGLGDTNDRSSPVQIGTATFWAEINASASTFLIKNDGTLWATGYNTVGVLGLGDTVHRSSPVQVGTQSWKKIVYGTAADRTHGIRSDGSLWGWGNGINGRLGLSNTTIYSSPVQVGTLTSWIDFAGATDHSLAIRE